MFHMLHVPRSFAIAQDDGVRQEGKHVTLGSFLRKELGDSPEDKSEELA